MVFLIFIIDPLISEFLLGISHLTMAVLQKCLFIKNYHNIININCRKFVFNFDVPCDAHKFISRPILKMITGAGYFNESFGENNPSHKKGKDSMETRAKPAVLFRKIDKKASVSESRVLIKLNSIDL